MTQLLYKVILKSNESIIKSLSYPKLLCRRLRRRLLLLHLHQWTTIVRNWYTYVTIPKLVLLSRAISHVRKEKPLSVIHVIPATKSHTALPQLWYPEGLCMWYIERPDLSSSLRSDSDLNGWRESPSQAPLLVSEMPCYRFARLLASC